MISPHCATRWGPVILENSSKPAGKSWERLFDEAGRKRMNWRSQEAPETLGVGREPLQGYVKACHRMG
jgi:hypothetical protein